MALQIAFSPCPNDTFTFYHWAHGNIPGAPEVEVNYGDIQELNQWAMAGRYPLSKISFHCLGKVLDDYIMLPNGAALGHRCGPKIIARAGFDIAELSSKSMAVPGKETSAQLLTTILFEKPRSTHFCRYDQVMDLINRGIVDCGLIIHESRFTFQKAGFIEIVDIGDIWEQRYQLPIPLGCLVARRDLGTEYLHELSSAVMKSLKKAQENPNATKAYIKQYSQEKDWGVVKSHIDLYVNEESAQLSEQGHRAIKTLLALGRERKLLPESAAPWILDDSISQLSL